MLFYPDVKACSSYILTVAGDGEEIAVVVFNSSATTLVNLTRVTDLPTRQSVLTALEGIQASGATSIAAGWYAIPYTVATTPAIRPAQNYDHLLLDQRLLASALLLFRIKSTAEFLIILASTIAGCNSVL